MGYAAGRARIRFENMQEVEKGVVNEKLDEE